MSRISPHSLTDELRPRRVSVSSGLFRQTSTSEMKASTVDRRVSDFVRMGSISSETAIRQAIVGVCRSATRHARGRARGRRGVDAMRASASASMAVASTSRAAACAIARAAGRRRGDATRRVRGSLGDGARTRGVRSGARDWARRGWRHSRDATRSRRLQVAGRTGAGFEIRVVVRARRRVSRGRRRNTRGRRGRTFARRFRRFRRYSDRLLTTRGARQSPFCSISFIDESVDDGEGVFDAPMDARRRRNGHGTEARLGPGAPGPAAAAVARRGSRDDVRRGGVRAGVGGRDGRPSESRGGVCAGGGVRGQACSKAGSAEIHAAVAGAAPATWRCEQRRVGAVPSGVRGARHEGRQTTHVRVTPATAVATVVAPDRPLGYVPRSNFVYERRRKGEDAASAARRGARVAAAGPSLPWKPPAGAGVDGHRRRRGGEGRGRPRRFGRGRGAHRHTGRDRNEKKAGPRRPGLTRARRARRSARPASVRGAAEYVFESAKPVRVRRRETPRDGARTREVGVFERKTNATVVERISSPYRISLQRAVYNTRARWRARRPARTTRRLPTKIPPEYVLYT